MTETRALATAAPTGVVAFSNEQMEVLRKTIASDLTNDEFALFGQVCNRTGLDPFAKQIYAIARGTGQYRKVTFQTGIDGYRLIAERTGEYDGQEGPEWCGQDGVWVDVWLQKEPPAAARVGVWRKGRSRPTWGTALWKEYCQKDRDGKPTDMWNRMGANQLAKCAEALALRKAFPNEVSGVYTREEMEQADNEAAVIDVTPAPTRREQIEAGRERVAEVRQEQAAAKAAKAAEPDWTAELKDLLAPASVSDLWPIVGGPPVTKRRLEAWRESEGLASGAAAAALVDAYRALQEFNSAGETVDTETGEIIEGESHPVETAPPPDEEWEDDGPTFREMMAAMFDRASAQLGKPVSIQHANAALALGAKSVNAAWAALEEWAENCEGDAVDSLFRAIIATYG